MQYADVIIVRGVPFLLPACKMIATAQQAGKKEHLFQTKKLSNVFISFMSVHYRPLPIQINTFGKIYHEVLFNNLRLMDL